MSAYETNVQEQRAYMALCDKARGLGIPTSLDDPRSPKTVDELQAAVDEAPPDDERKLA